MRDYRTSEIAERFGIHPNTVMLYEKWGYIASVKREENGYRVFNEIHVEQIKLIRKALRGKLIKSYMKFEVQNIIRSAAQGDLRKALELSKAYLTHIQNEKNTEFKVVETIQKILKSHSQEEKSILLNRSGAAELIGVSKHVIINWERYGLIKVPRSKNGYRIYGKKEIKLLRIIKVLRKENYSTQCIGGMLKKLKTKSKAGDMLLYEDTGNSNERLLSSLSEIENNAKELISYISELINKKTEI